MASFIFQIISGSVLILILLTIRCGDTTDLDCVPSIRVPRNTVWKASEKTTLRINCTILTESHCWKDLSVLWCKITDTGECISMPIIDSTYRDTEWKKVNGNQRVFFLIFWNLSMQDAGLYRCWTDAPAPVSTSGHAISVNVTASATDFEKVSDKNITQHINTTTDNRDTEQNVVKHLYLLYFIAIAGILVLSVPVLIKTMYRKEYSLEDKDILTTLFYEEAEDSSLQE